MLLVLAVGILTGTAAAVAAERQVRLIVNGSEVETETPPRMVNGSVMVPIRAVAEALDKQVQWNGQTSEVSIEDHEQLLTQYSKGGHKVEIWGRKVDGAYWGMRMSVGDTTRNFPFWYNVGNLSYAPQVILEDLTQDGKNELLVILTTGYGTGMRNEEAHIFDSETFREIPLEHWQTYALQHIKLGEVSAEGAHIRIGDNDKFISHGIPAEEYKAHLNHWYDKPAYGQVIRYEVRQGDLYAVLPLWYSPAHSQGQLEIRYAYEDDFFQGKAVNYVD